MEETVEFLNNFAVGGDEGVFSDCQPFTDVCRSGVLSMGGGIFRFTGYFVVEYMAGLGTIIRHTKVHRAPLIVPVEVDTEEYFVLPIDGTSVFLGKVTD